jgi:pimeloyl-ACP methyl ester carboxylesterase
MIGRPALWIAVAALTLAGPARGEGPDEKPADRRFGLSCPADLRPQLPLVVLIHGLNGDHRCFDDLVAAMRGSAIQAATFDYPNDQPIQASGKLLAAEIKKLRAARPAQRLALVSHSMGGLVARAFVEGPEYRGGVERLLMVAPPNGGSSCARYSFCTEWSEHFGLARTNPGWSWSWMKTDGKGEASSELMPESEFLAELNSRSRREGVQYTIIAGNRHLACRYGANLVDFAAEKLPDKTRYVKQARLAASMCAARIRNRACQSDGIVDLDSVRLPGVEDLVVVPADHATILCRSDDQPPPAWPPLAERLAPATSLATAQP